MQGPPFSGVDGAAMDTHTADGLITMHLSLVARVDLSLGIVGRPGDHRHGMALGRQRFADVGNAEGLGLIILTYHQNLHAGAGPRVHPVADASDGGPLPAGLRAGRDPAGRGSAARGYAVSVLPAGQRRAQLRDGMARTGRHTPRGARPGRPARPHPPVLPPLEC